MGIPPYLLVFLLEVRRHENEPGYLASRCRGGSLDRAIYERGLVSELLQLDLIYRSRSDDVLTFPVSAEQDLETGFTASEQRTESVYFPRRFVVAPRGRHALRLALFRFVFWVATIWVAQQVPEVIGLVIGKLP